MPFFEKTRCHKPTNLKTPTLLFLVAAFRLHDALKSLGVNAPARVPVFDDKNVLQVVDAREHKQSEQVV
jgi:hypothetical protein